MGWDACLWLLFGIAVPNLTSKFSRDLSTYRKNLFDIAVKGLGTSNFHVNNGIVIACNNLLFKKQNKKTTDGGLCKRQWKR